MFSSFFFRKTLHLITFAILVILIAIAGFSLFRWVSGDGNFEAWYTLILIPVGWLASVIKKQREQLLVNDVSSNRLAPAISQEERNRRQLIQNVRTAWIHGVLDQTLSQSVWLELGYKPEPYMVNQPWHLLWQSQGESYELPSNISIADVFHEKAANALLIVGAPGSGKTITLLDLARQLLDEAEKKNSPIPVVFNLSSWVLKRQSFQEWLVIELNEKYYVPKKVGQYWLENDALLLLLDGLDEATETYRQDCVKAINTYRHEHGLTGVVVCCRYDEYKALHTNLDLMNAVEIQPLTLAKADDYLRRLGKGQKQNDLTAVRKLLKEDDQIREWVETPLFLNVVAVAYRGYTLEELRELHTGKLYKLYDAYVDRVLRQHRQYPIVKYDPENTKKWLAWLAGRLEEYEQTEYLIENMQRSWAFAKVIQPKRNRLVTQLLAILMGKDDIIIQDTPWSWATVKHELGESIFIGGVGIGLGFGIVLGVAGLLATYMSSASLSLGDRILIGVAAGSISMLVFGILFGPFTGIALALSSGMVENSVRPHERPNQGIWRSSLVTLITEISMRTGIMLIPIMFIGLFIPYGEPEVWPLGDPIFFVFMGLAWTLIPGLILTLKILVKHFALRGLLAYFGYLPFYLVPFLEYARERLLLRRVGGSYIFVHRTLQEYFAELDKNTLPPA